MWAVSLQRQYIFIKKTGQKLKTEEKNGIINKMAEGQAVWTLTDADRLLLEAAGPFGDLRRCPNPDMNGCRTARKAPAGRQPRDQWARTGRSVGAPLTKPALPMPAGIRKGGDNCRRREYFNRGRRGTPIRSAALPIAGGNERSIGCVHQLLP